MGQPLKDVPVNAARVERGRDDGGYALIMSALVLVGLLVFAAFALDLGQVAAARRTDQGAADAAAMAGAIAAAQGDNATAVRAAVIAVAETNLEVASGTLDWNSCGGYVDPGTGWASVSGSNCIMRSGDRILVRLPAQSLKSTFGAVVGRSSYSHRAFAVAGPQTLGFGGILPFGVFSTGSGHVCLRTDNPSSPISPCAGSSTGDSGILNLGLYGNSALGTPNNCNGNGGGANGRAANNAAAGADHRIGKHPTADTTNLDTGTKCSNGDTSPPYPYAADTITGAGADQAITSGLIAGSEFYDGQPARLQRSAVTPFALPKITVEGHSVDNTPLWVFIGDGLTEVPSGCRRIQFEDALTAGFGQTPNANSIPDAVEDHLDALSLEVRMEKMLQRCFDLYTFGNWDDDGAFSTTDVPPGENVTSTECPTVPSGTYSRANPRCVGVVFSRNSAVETPEIYDLQLTPRFAYVPQIHPSFSLGANQVSFVAFQPVYLQRLCMGNAQCNQGTFSPGRSAVGTNLWVDEMPGNVNDNISALSAWAFPRSMLPGGLGGDNAPYDLNVNIFLRLLR